MFVDVVVVAIYKRAQILVADIWACCGGQGIGTFTDIDTLTAFADYRIPQALVWFGVLQYSEHLMELLHAGAFVQVIVSIILLLLVVVGMLIENRKTDSTSLATGFRIF